MRINIDDAEFAGGLVLTYQGEPFTGEVIETTRSGQVVALSGYREGFPHGPATEWYPSGGLRSEGTVDRGIAVGVHREWYPDGRPAKEKQFDGSGSQLSVRSWDENGVLMEDKDFR